MSKPKHLAGDTQRGWIGGGLKYQRPPRPCPSCGTDMESSWKRACSLECFVKLKTAAKRAKP